MSADAIANQLGLRPTQRGVVVTEVDLSTAAAVAGLQAGDVIEEVNHKPVRNLNEYQQAIDSMGNQPVLLLINRRGTTHYVIVRPQ